VRQLLLLGPLVALISACSPVALVGTPAPTDKAPYTQAPPTPTLSAIATVAPTGHGRPYTAEMIAVELRSLGFAVPDPAVYSAAK